MKKSLISSLIAACLGCALASPLPASPLPMPVASLCNVSAVIMDIPSPRTTCGKHFCQPFLKQNPREK